MPEIAAADILLEMRWLLETIEMNWPSIVAADEPSSARKMINFLVHELSEFVCGCEMHDYVRLWLQLKCVPCELLSDQNRTVSSRTQQTVLVFAQRPRRLYRQRQKSTDL